MTYQILNVEGTVLKDLAESKITNFKTKIKITKILKWFNAQVELLQEGFKAINEKFDLVELNQYDEDSNWKGTDEELSIYITAFNEANKDRAELLSSEVDEALDTKLQLTEDEVEEIPELTSLQLVSLVTLDVLLLEE